MLKYIITSFTLILYATSNCCIYSQTAPDKYLVRFTDKANNPYSTDQPEEFLSVKAIERRTIQGISIEENDLPVTPSYIESIETLGATVLTSSKWFNAVTIYASDPLILDDIENLPFVQSVEKTKCLKGSKPVPDKFAFPLLNQDKGICETNSQDYGLGANQIQMLNGHILHDMGFMGEGMDIAVIDAGFRKTDSLAIFDSLFINGSIKGTKDFVNSGSSFVYDHHNHGTYVLSIIGGNLPGQLVGTAPKANYWLLRSEDGESEYLIEEDNWVAAAEFADSAGVDVINTSLGYKTFNDSTQNHVYADMDGNTTRIAIGADIAASKGMIIVSSAGNDGNSPWHYITTPADADSILAVGAVDSAGIYAEFSSKGPASDGDIKPDIAAQGQGTYVTGLNGDIFPGSGTSFAAPIIAGLATCLWQANPDASNIHIMNAIRQSASQYYNPDSLMGYGIPDFAQANMILQGIIDVGSDQEILINTFPNPFANKLTIQFYSTDSQDVIFEIFDITGRNVFSMNKEFNSNSLNTININEVSGLKQGTYILKVRTQNNEYQKVLVKN